MDEYTWLCISICIDMEVISASCNTSSNVFSVVLEIKCKNLLSTGKATDFSYSVIHILSLLFCRKQIYCRIISNRDIMEIPCITASFFNDHIQKFIGCNRLNIGSCIADRCSKDLSMSFQKIHRMHDFFIDTFSTTTIINFLISFQTDGKSQISYPFHLITKFFIYKRSIRKCMEFAVIVLLT